MAGPDHDPLPIHPGSDPVGHDVFHLAVHFLVGEPFIRRLAHNGVGHGMGEMFLQAGRIPEHCGPGQVPGQQIGEQGPAQAPGHQTVGQMAGPAFQVGLEIS